MAGPQVQGRSEVCPADRQFVAQFMKSENEASHADVMAPIRRLTKQNVKLKWTKDCKEAFKELKTRIYHKMVLVSYDQCCSPKTCWVCLIWVQTPRQVAQQPDEGAAGRARHRDGGGRQGGMSGKGLARDLPRDYARTTEGRQGQGSGKQRSYSRRKEPGSLVKKPVKDHTARSGPRYGREMASS